MYTLDVCKCHKCFIFILCTAYNITTVSRPWTVPLTVYILFRIQFLEGSTEVNKVLWGIFVIFMPSEVNFWMFFKYLYGGLEAYYFATKLKILFIHSM